MAKSIESPYVDLLHENPKKENDFGRCPEMKCLCKGISIEIFQKETNHPRRREPTYLFDKTTQQKKDVFSLD